MQQQLTKNELKREQGGYVEEFRGRRQEGKLYNLYDNLKIAEIIKK